MSVVQGAFNQLFTPGLAAELADIYQGDTGLCPHKNKRPAHMESIFKCLDCGVFLLTPNFEDWVEAWDNMPVVNPNFSEIPIWRRKPRYLESPIRAWRAWNVTAKAKGWMLSSVARDCDWHGPFIKSDYRPLDPAHWKADRELSGRVIKYSGIWAVKSQGQVIEVAAMYSAQVYGEVDLWGRVAIHRLGYRAEFCMIKKLYVVRRRTAGWANTDKIRKALEDRYQCDVEMI